MTSFRRCWPYALTLVRTGCIAAILTGAAAAEDRQRPNIIYVMADDLGYGELGCYGQAAIKTPHIDHMAAEGMRFTDCYAGSTVCAPSRCSLMTGLHTGHAYVRGNSEIKPGETTFMGQLPLPAGTATLAGVLQRAGYATALVGKWGLGGPGSTGIPNKQGFDYFFGYLCQRHAHNAFPDFLYRNEEEMPLGNVVRVEPQPRGFAKAYATKRVDYSNDLFNRESLDFIERRKDGPFFLYLASIIPHTNSEMGERGVEVPDLGPYADKDWIEPKKAYAATISRLDDSVGLILAKLKQLGLDNKTIIFVTSDNGPEKHAGADPAYFDSSGPLRGYKRSLHDGGIRVPMIVRWPGHIQAGTTSNLVWAFWDVLPTFAELAGAETPPGGDGLSVVPTLLGRPGQKEHKFLYWEFHEGRTSAQAVRMGNWKAVRPSPNSPLQLYELGTDLGETHDLAAEHPDVVATIEDYLKTARTESEYWPMKGD